MKLCMTWSLLPRNEPLRIPINAAAWFHRFLVLWFWTVFLESSADLWFKECDYLPRVSTVCLARSWLLFSPSWTAVHQWKTLVEEGKFLEQKLETWPHLQTLHKRPPTCKLLVCLVLIPKTSSGGNFTCAGLKIEKRMHVNLLSSTRTCM